MLADGFMESVQEKSRYFINKLEDGRSKNIHSWPLVCAGAVYCLVCC